MIILEIYREGVHLIPTGGRYDQGRIIMTKHINQIEISDFLTELLDGLRFPGSFSVDAHGFVETKLGEPVFVFGSTNSSILLWNDKQSVLLKR